MDIISNLPKKLNIASETTDGAMSKEHVAEIKAQMKQQEAQAVILDKLQGDINQINTQINNTSGISPYDNCTNNLKSKWSTLPVGNCLFTLVTSSLNNASGSDVSVMYYKHTSGNYGWALLMSYVLVRPIYIYLCDGAWSEPVWI